MSQKNVGVFLLTTLLLVGCQNREALGEIANLEENVIQPTYSHKEVETKELSKSIDLELQPEEVKSKEETSVVENNEVKILELDPNEWSNAVVYPVDEPIEVDLNGDGQAEKILYKVTASSDSDNPPKASLYIDDVLKASGSVLQDNGIQNGIPKSEFAIVDIDTNDSFKELAFFNEYPQIGYYTSYFKYNARGIICSLGIIQNDYNAILGDGTVIVAQRDDAQENVVIEQIYQLHRNRLVERN